MAANKGNQFWKLRNKHGRDKLFASSSLLWEAACEYFEWCEKNPMVEYGWGGTKKNILRPYTLSGLCLYLDVNTQYFTDFKKALPEGEQDFSLVINKIEQTIYTQKFEGAAVGLFNANIIARDLGLKDSTDVTSGGEKITGFTIEIVDNEPTT